tara:strand:+ start:70492 stop:70701 length:210 start_codon:yes stop_codon:yes gene_type:complete
MHGEIRIRLTKDGFADAQSCIRHGDAIVTGKVRDNDATEISGLAMSRRNPGLRWDGWQYRPEHHRDLSI